MKKFCIYTILLFIYIILVFSSCTSEETHFPLFEYINSEWKTTQSNDQYKIDPEYKFKILSEQNILLIKENTSVYTPDKQILTTLLDTMTVSYKNDSILLYTHVNYNNSFHLKDYTKFYYFGSIELNSNKNKFILYLAKNIWDGINIGEIPCIKTK